MNQALQHDIDALDNYLNATAYMRDPQKRDWTAAELLRLGEDLRDYAESLDHVSLITPKGVLAGMTLKQAFKAHLASFCAACRIALDTNTPEQNIADFETLHAKGDEADQAYASAILMRGVMGDELAVAMLDELPETIRPRRLFQSNCTTNQN